MRNFTFYILIFIVAIVASRIVSERALKPLSAEEKSTLLDSFSKYRTYGPILILGLSLAYIAAMIYLRHSFSTLTLIFIILIFTLSGTFSVLSYQKLKNLNMPGGYIRSFLISHAIAYVGIAAMLLPTMW